MKHLKKGDVYIEADMSSGQNTYVYFNSLQAFWPGMQCKKKQQILKKKKDK